MATIALSLAGQFVGGLVGGPIGATVGRALGALAGSAVDATLFGEQAQRRPGSDIRLLGSSQGGAVPRLYGWARVSGNIIWATELEELPGAAGSKGLFASEPDAPVIAASFAIGLCEGEVARLGRIWADGDLLETEGLTLRFYSGSETQLPDSLIEAKQGAGQAPAYRGLCYLVFERLPLDRFGNRIPNISVELCRPVGTLEPAIRAVTLIPGATEFGYDPVPLVRLLSPGMTEVENTHLSRNLSDFTLSVDELQALCPNLAHVSLVVSWFGDDLRAGTCSVAPRVEAAERTIIGTNWCVSGIGRAAATVVSSHDGGPAYGGTPSDAAVLAAIADLKARGLKVTLYPLLMMDVPAGNTLPDPLSGEPGQAAYPWRGRIMPASGGNVATAVAAFVGAADAGDFVAGDGTVTYAGPAEWSYRRIVLHYAHLVEMAGGVDAFIIGSELRGLTGARHTDDGFPFVDALVQLAADVSEVLDPATLVTYAADWTEYHGWQPPEGGGEKIFNLDPLWSSPHIDAVGIDNYMPLADWRDGSAHADAGEGGPYGLGYLGGNIAGGEGFDWYYATDADRLAQVRSPIADGAHGEHWIWRYKDLLGWWSNAHHDRPGGVRAGAPTAWVPQGKPFWFTELGCPAVDKGANQPNIFGDAKSSESGRPYFSSGGPDPLIQRQFLRAHLAHWNGDANPESTLYDGRMVDPERVYLWTWDARPFPAFPQQRHVWSDGPNHATGHWLTGRLGQGSAADLIEAIAADYQVPLAGVDTALPQIEGLLVEQVTTARDVLAPVLATTGLTLRDEPDGIRFIAPGVSVATLDLDDLARGSSPLLSRRRTDPTAKTGRLVVTYADRERAYQASSVTALRQTEAGAAEQATGLVLDEPAARLAAERLLLALAEGDTLDFALPPSLLQLEAGDVVSVGATPVILTEIRDGDARQVSARTLPAPATIVVESSATMPRLGRPAAQASPIVAVAHVPVDGTSQLLLAAWAQPWPGSVAVTDPHSDRIITRLSQPAVMGELLEDLPPGPVEGWDDVNMPLLRMYSGHIAARDDAAVLAGANRLLVEADDGAWEMLGFGEATLESGGIYRLAHLRRGMEGTGNANSLAAAGRRVILLDAGVVRAPVNPSWVGETIEMIAYSGADDATGTMFDVVVSDAPLVPLAPTDLTIERVVDDDLIITWQRASRRPGIGWDDAPALDYLPEAYRLTIFDGPDVVRTIDVGARSATYAASEQIADFGTLAGPVDIAVAQVSSLFGPGRTIRETFDD